MVKSSSRPDVTRATDHAAMTGECDVAGIRQLNHMFRPSQQRDQLQPAH